MFTKLQQTFLLIHYILNTCGYSNCLLFPLFYIKNLLNYNQNAIKIKKKHITLLKKLIPFKVFCSLYNILLIDFMFL